MKPILEKIETDKKQDEKEEIVEEEIKIPEKKLNIIKPIKDFQTFETIDEFNKFYESNKKQFEELTTCKLNKMYRINGFRITKIKRRN